MDTFIITTDRRLYADYFRKMTYFSLCECGLYPKIIANRKPFECYLLTEKMANTDIYLVADDDIVVGDPMMIEHAYSMMRDNPSIGIMGFAYQKGIDASRYGSWLKENIKDSIYEIDHVGGILLLRKGAVKDYGERPDHSVGIAHDRTLADAVRKSGFKVCIDLSLHYHHIGEGYQTTLI